MQDLYKSKLLDCRYDTETGIFYKYYFGNIEFNDIVYSWNEIIENRIIPEKTSKFILDYTSATYTSAPETASKIAQFYKQNEHIFSGARLAFIMQRSNQVILPVVVDAECSFMSVKPFFTIDRAQYWLRNFTGPTLELSPNNE